MIGLVIVSHSARLADGVVELVAEMGGPDLRVAAAGGLDLPERPLGTDVALILSAIDAVYSPDGVLVLMDLGSAILSAEMALDLLEPEQRDHVRLCPAPLVEGAVVAAVQIKLGSPIEQVMAAARAALGSKIAHLGGEESAAGRASATSSAPDSDSIQVTLNNPHGLHLRPAARLLQIIGQYDAEVTVRSPTPGGESASGRSINALITLGARQGDTLEIIASGPDRAAVLGAVQDLADANWGDAEREAAVSRPESAAPAKSGAGSGCALQGQPGPPGIGMGPARLRARPRLTFSERPSGPPDAEWAFLINALAKARAELTTGERGAEDGIFAAHRLYLDDPALLDPARRQIYSAGSSAAAAWAGAIAALEAAYEAMPDPYLRARSADIHDLGQRVLRHLPGVAIEADAEPAEPGIVIADSLMPSEVAALDPATAIAVALAGGSATGHAAILARARGILLVAGVGPELLALADGTPLIVDGETGQILINPDAATSAEYSRRRSEQAERRARELSEAQQPAVTRSGRRITVEANIGSVNDAKAAMAAGAEGVGVFRTEFLFLDRTVAPGEDEQVAVYRAVAAELAGQPLIIRTLDAGGDKALPYINQPREANPFLGLRGLRLCLAQQELFKTQLRAALRTALEYPAVRIMFPMVTALAEVRAAKACLAEAASEVNETTGKPVPPIEVGIMIEVPSAALLAGGFAPEVDFFSIGTNDLTQYTLAAERDNPALAALSDGLHPAVLRLIGQVVKAAHVHGKPVTVCGELAGDPAAVPLLLALGVDCLSMTPASIPLIKQTIRGCDERLMADRLPTFLGLESADAVRTALRSG